MVIYIQEYWLLTDDQIQDLNSVSSDHTVFGFSGFEQTDILRGRPFGGCAIFIRFSLNVKISLIDTGSRRICAIRSQFDFGSLMFINVYMPYENDDASSDDFRLQLAIIDNIIEQNSNCHVVCGCDFNVDFDRYWSHTNILNNFCDERFLIPVVRHKLNTIDYSYNFGMKRFQFLGSFFCIWSTV